MENKKEVIYLGDVFNKKGDLQDLIEDRIKRGMSCLINSIALCNEINIGEYRLQTLLVLYHTIFLSSILYNAQTWTQISNNDMSKLNIIQLKFLKRMLRTASSTPNAVILLELGILPIGKEIHKRQLNFLHHILQLTEDDPVKRMYYRQKSL